MLVVFSMYAWALDGSALQVCITGILFIYMCLL